MIERSGQAYPLLEPPTLLNKIYDVEFKDKKSYLYKTKLCFINIC